VPADSPGEAENITLGAEEEGDLWDFKIIFVLHHPFICGSMAIFIFVFHYPVVTNYVPSGNLT